MKCLTGQLSFLWHRCCKFYGQDVAQNCEEQAMAHLRPARFAPPVALLFLIFSGCYTQFEAADGNRSGDEDRYAAEYFPSSTDSAVSDTVSAREYEESRAQFYFNYYYPGGYSLGFGVYDPWYWGPQCWSSYSWCWGVPYWTWSAYWYPGLYDPWGWYPGGWYPPPYPSGSWYPVYYPPSGVYTYGTPRHIGTTRTIRGSGTYNPTGVVRGGGAASVSVARRSGDVRGGTGYRVSKERSVSVLRPAGVRTPTAAKPGERVASRVDVPVRRDRPDRKNPSRYEQPSRPSSQSWDPGRSSDRSPSRSGGEVRSYSPPPSSSSSAPSHSGGGSRSSGGTRGGGRR